MFRILKHWLNAGEPDPFYDPLNDYVVLPTAFELERVKERCFQVAKEEWEVIPKDLNVHDENVEVKEHQISLISVSEVASHVSRVSVQ